MASPSDRIIIPNKFVALMLHLIATTMLYFSYPDNIIAAYPNIDSTSSDLYVGGKVSFMAANSLSIIFLCFELIIFFVGVNMFRERFNIFIATIHYVGSILYTVYGFQQWQFQNLWALWFIFTFLPLSLEIVAIIANSKP